MIRRARQPASGDPPGEAAAVDEAQGVIEIGVGALRVGVKELMVTMTAWSQRW